MWVVEAAWSQFDWRKGKRLTFSRILRSWGPYDCLLLLLLRLWSMFNLGCFRQKCFESQKMMISSTVIKLSKTLQVFIKFNKKIRNQGVILTRGRKIYRNSTSNGKLHFSQFENMDI